MKKKKQKTSLGYCINILNLSIFLSSDDENWQSIMGKVIKKNNKGKQSFLNFFTRTKSIN